MMAAQSFGGAFCQQRIQLPCCFSETLDLANQARLR